MVENAKIIQKIQILGWFVSPVISFTFIPNAAAASAAGRKSSVNIVISLALLASSVDARASLRDVKATT